MKKKAKRPDFGKIMEHGNCQHYCLAHISDTTEAWLKAQAAAEGPAITVYENQEDEDGFCGFWIQIPKKTAKKRCPSGLPGYTLTEPARPDGVPDDLWGVMELSWEYAQREPELKWLLIDADGIVDDVELPLYRDYAVYGWEDVPEESGAQETGKEKGQEKEPAEGPDPMDSMDPIQALIDEGLEKIWDSLTDVPFSEDQDGRLLLDCNWFGFPSGTEREEIWHWFDGRHSKGVYYLLYERKHH